MLSFHEPWLGWTFTVASTARGMARPVMEALPGAAGQNWSTCHTSPVLPRSVLRLYRAGRFDRGLGFPSKQSLQTLREALQLVVREAGYQITFNPGSAPELVDYLLVAGPDNPRPRKPQVDETLEPGV